MESSRKNIKPERIYELAQLIQRRLDNSMREINSINEESGILSINAQVEAARAAEAGRSFSVVATEMKQLSAKTSKVTKDLTKGVLSVTKELTDISKRLSFDVRGQRLCDLAMYNIELIDRNLYERTCDVRWWATDASLTHACNSNGVSEACSYASKRLGVILEAYTVYFDLVLCDRNGRIITNGRPGLYTSKGKDVSESEWFQKAVNTISGNEYGFETVHKSELINNEYVLAYSCSVRTNGDAHGDVEGVLGILFKWASLAQTILKRTAIDDDEWAHTRALIVDNNGMILADTKDQILEKIEFDGMDELFNKSSGFMEASVNDSICLIAHAKSPGYETYHTGWNSLIIQEKNLGSVALKEE